MNKNFLYGIIILLLNDIEIDLGIQHTGTGAIFNVK